jgi:Alr-MurF fusion protein
MQAYALHDIASMAGGLIRGNLNPHGPVKELLTDSRKLIIPASTLFVALISRKNDGHRFIPGLIEKGVCFFMVSNLPEIYLQQYPEISFILVDDTLAALQRLASNHRKKFSLPVVAVTGSNGKTIIKEWLFQLLMDRKNIVRNPKSYNSQLGVPLSVIQIQQSHQLGIFEAGISQPGEMDNLREIIRPDIGIFSNIGSAHDEGFSSTQEKIFEKLALFSSCRGLIYCSDHFLISSAIRKWHQQNPSVQLFDWSFSPGSSFQVLSLDQPHNSSHIRVLYENEQHEFVIPFTDKASVENAMHCLAFLFYTGFMNGWIPERTRLLQPVAMRLEMKEGINRSLIINDSYNSDITSLAIALDFLGNQTRYKNRTLILSDIHQSGRSVEELYTEVASMLSARKINRLIGIGTDISSQSSLFSERSVFYNDSDTFIREFDFSVLQEEAILIKGARVFGFEKISTLLQQKDHETILEVNLDALVHNLDVFRSMIKPGVKIMAMVKAFSYGSGSVEIAATLQYHQVDYLAVAYADEGKELRNGGIHLPIVVMNPEVKSFEILFRYQLQPEVYSLSLLEKLAVAAKKYPHFDKQNPLLIHIKLDTGMHRLGFLPEQVPDLTELLKDYSHLKIATVFSHLAASEEPQQDDFTRSQIKLFELLCQNLKKELGYDFLMHLCNTSAISRFPEANFDIVRPGVGLYGVSNDQTVQPLLQQVNTFKSVVSQLKHVKAGNTIGYNRAAKASKEITIAVIPVGYADGLNRHLGNGRGKLLINGKLVPTIGNISMDMCTVDVTDIDVKEGDEVTIFGKDHPVQHMAEALNTIPYEIFTSVSHRVKRIYFQE